MATVTKIHSTPMGQGYITRHCQTDPWWSRVIPGKGTKPRRSEWSCCWRVRPLARSWLPSSSARHSTQGVFVAWIKDCFRSRTGQTGRCGWWAFCLRSGARSCCFWTTAGRTLTFHPIGCPSFLYVVGVLIFLNKIVIYKMSLLLITGV